MRFLLSPNGVDVYNSWLNFSPLKFLYLQLPADLHDYSKIKPLINSSKLVGFHFTGFFWAGLPCPSQVPSSITMLCLLFWAEAHMNHAKSWNYSELSCRLLASEAVEQNQKKTVLLPGSPAIIFGSRFRTEADYYGRQNSQYQKRSWKSDRKM